MIHHTLTNNINTATKRPFLIFPLYFLRLWDFLTTFRPKSSSLSTASQRHFTYNIKTTITEAIMHASTIAAILAFTASALALPAKTTYGNSKRDTSVAFSRCDEASDVALCETVVNAVAGWDDSVNAVNLFLNTAASLSGSDLTAAEQIASDAASKEPGFLGTLLATPGLSDDDIASANDLGTNIFPIVPTTFSQLLNSEIGVADALNNINTPRCASILPDIGRLWQAAAAAAGADTPGFPLGPHACLKNPDNTGDAYVLDN